MKYFDKVLEAKNYLIKEIGNRKIDLGIVLGSGLGFFADYLEDKVAISFKDIPNFGTSRVVGHSNRIIVGNLKGKRVLVMEGRIHYYEGFSMKEVTLPIRVMKELGINKLILTNSAGGIGIKPGTLMLIEDHLDLFCPNPLLGENVEEQGTRFPDMSEVYSKKLINKLISVNENLGVNLDRGVYSYLTGPSYETPFDIKVLGKLGVSAVGMSTVPEAIVASHCGMEVLGISCITNLAAGISNNPLTHEEVVETTNRVSKDFVKLLTAIVEVI